MFALDVQVKLNYYCFHENNTFYCVITLYCVLDGIYFNISRPITRKVIFHAKNGSREIFIGFTTFHYLAFIRRKLNIIVTIILESSRPVLIINL